MRILLFGCRSGQRLLLARGATAMNGIMNQKAQNLIEYAIIVSVIAAAMVAMSTYVFRSVQATQKVIQEGYAQ